MAYVLIKDCKALIAWLFGGSPYIWFVCLAPNCIKEITRKEKRRKVIPSIVASPALLKIAVLKNRPQFFVAHFIDHLWLINDR